MQRDRWKAKAAAAYRDPSVRVRKRLVTAAAKLRKLADTDLALEEVQKRRQKLVVRANAVGYQLTARAVLCAKRQLLWWEVRAYVRRRREMLLVCVPALW